MNVKFKNTTIRVSMNNGGSPLAVGATASVAGSAGLLPAPPAGTITDVLSRTLTWITTALLDVAQQWTAQQNFTSAAITSSSAHIAWGLNTAQFARHTMTENTTLDNPTNMVNGGTYVLILTQHASAAKTLAFGNAYKVPGGGGFTMSAGLSAVDVLTFVSDGSSMFMVGQKAFA